VVAVVAVVAVEEVEEVVEVVEVVRLSQEVVEVEEVVVGTLWRCQSNLLARRMAQVYNHRGQCILREARMGLQDLVLTYLLSGNSRKIIIHLQ
jgi:hypothetical protein